MTYLVSFKAKRAFFYCHRKCQVGSWRRGPCRTVYSSLCYRKLTGHATLPIKLLRVIPIARFPAVEKKCFPPVLLRLPRDGRQKGFSFELGFKTPFLDVTRIVHGGQVLSGSARVNRVAVWTTPPFQPYSACKAEEVAEYESVTPKPCTSAFGTGNGSFPVKLFAVYFNFL